MGTAGPCCTTGNLGCIGKEGPGGPENRQQKQMRVDAKVELKQVTADTTC